MIVLALLRVACIGLLSFVAGIVIVEGVWQLAVCVCLPLIIITLLDWEKHL